MWYDVIKADYRSNVIFHCRLLFLNSCYVATSSHAILYNENSVSMWTCEQTKTHSIYILTVFLSNPRTSKYAWTVWLADWSAVLHSTMDRSIIAAECFIASTCGHGEMATSQVWPQFHCVHFLHYLSLCWLHFVPLCSLRTQSLHSA